MKKIIVYILPLVLSIPVFAQGDFEKELLKQFHTISSREMMGWVEKLCSPEFNGRLTGTPGFIKSAEWVAGNFREWGLKPAGDNGSYYQWFDMPYTEVNDPGSLSLLLPQTDGTVITKKYSYPDEFFPGMNSGSGEITAEVVFAGYGITAPELNYDDYRGIDVKGKIVLVNRDVPYSDPTNPEYKKWVGYCYHQYKLENAVRHGAKGFLYVDGIGANPNISYDSSIIVCGIGSDALQDIFAGLNLTNAAVINKIMSTMKPSSFGTGKKFTLKANTTRHKEGRGCNVAALLEGSDSILKNEVIIIGGHLDAVGNSGKVVNGALDNASGIVDIMAAAKALSLSGNKIKRSILFLCLGGEENGLLGSKLYVSSPLFPKEKTVTYINLDMVGNGTGLFVGAGSEYTGFLDYFTSANQKYIHRNIRTAAPPVNQYYGRPRSDGVVFSLSGYRTMSIGTTDAVKKVYYHIPGDDPDAITIDIMEDVAKMIYVALTNMANDSDLK